jgi:hypothetical protein
MQQQGPRLTEQDIRNAKTLICDACSNKTFTNVFIIKHISALLSPNGQEINAPLPTFACAKCGHINKSFLPPDEVL